MFFTFNKIQHIDVWQPHSAKNIFKSFFPWRVLLICDTFHFKKAHIIKVNRPTRILDFDLFTCRFQKERFSFIKTICYKCIFGHFHIRLYYIASANVIIDTNRIATTIKIAGTYLLWGTRLLQLLSPLDSSHSTLCVVFDSSDFDITIMLQSSNV